MPNRTEAEPGLVYFSLFLYVYAYAVSTYVLHASACTFFPCWDIQYVVREEPLGKIPTSKANPEDSWTIPSTWWSWLFIFGLGRETIGNKDGLGNPIHLDLPILGWALTKFANFALRAPGDSRGSRGYMPWLTQWVLIPHIEYRRLSHRTHQQILNINEYDIIIVWGRVVLWPHMQATLDATSMLANLDQQAMPSTAFCIWLWFKRLCREFGSTVRSWASIGLNMAHYGTILFQQVCSMSFNLFTLSSSLASSDMV